MHLKYAVFAHISRESNLNCPPHNYGYRLHATPIIIYARLQSKHDAFLFYNALPMNRYVGNDIH